MRKSLKSIALFIAIALAGIACDSGDQFQESEDGYRYKFIRQTEGTKPQDGSYVGFNFLYKDASDSVLFSSEQQGGEIAIPVSLSDWQDGGPFYKALLTLSEGDSVVLKIPTKTLFEESFRTAVPAELDSAGDITFEIGVTRVMLPEEYEAYLADKAEEQLQKDIATIDEYLKGENIEAQSTESGLRYVITEEGTGESPVPGDKVEVHYTGSLLDGEQFDSSLERGPFSFNIGQGMVIPGWDEGIALFKEGGKGTLYIPSNMAYGQRGAGGVIGPNSVLKFDVELLNVEKQE
jgi:FKBP-type peptidyl-prolyl cis-trans isomerase